MQQWHSRHLFTLILILIVPNIVFSQEPKEEKYPRGAQYFLGSDDELLIKVNIWGYVNKPGQYMVPSDTDLISLISYAGGPGRGAKLTSVKIVRSKGKENPEEKIIDVNVKKYLAIGKESLIPQLLPGDTIVISGSRWHYLNSFLEFTTKIALLAQIYFLIDYYGSR